MTRVHTAVLIGRFQPFHNGHLALLEQALQVAQQVIVVLGSAHQARSPKNPWVWEERRKMIDDCLPTRVKGRVQFVPIRDYYDLPRWVAEVQRWVEALVPLSGASIGLISHEKDASSAYLRHFPKWRVIELPRQGEVDATPLRDQFWNLDNQPAAQVQAALAAALPEPVLQILTAWQETPAYAAVREEAQALAAYREAWSCAAFAPVFVTVDTLVVCAQHVLLVQRGHSPGKGLLALPGGFVEQRDTIEESAQRELQEETGLTLTPDAWQAALQGVEIFDHPDRSLRGRTITHVYVLHLPGDTLPEVNGGDDAAAADWVPLKELWELEPQFFEDHFHILRTCFERFGGGPLPKLP
ncbi:MAG: bifunctional nicotinamide-nucleotide adenylyltransferase/Nudix hydroxylase [Comamonas sp.]|nr:bifunctional nicotinamide-nucleotide adenylyltransferase/Nudix hydroxylase [Comamonas sp.]